jgi:hypothetical protein
MSRHDMIYISIVSPHMCRIISIRMTMQFMLHVWQCKTCCACKVVFNLGGSASDSPPLVCPQVHHMCKSLVLIPHGHVPDCSREEAQTLPCSACMHGPVLSCRVMGGMQLARQTHGRRRVNTIYTHSLPLSYFPRPE